MKYIVNILDRKVFLHLHFSIWFCVSFAITEIVFTVNRYIGKGKEYLIILCLYPLASRLSKCAFSQQHTYHTLFSKSRPNKKFSL